MMFALDIFILDYGRGRDKSAIKGSLVSSEHYAKFDFIPATVQIVAVDIRIDIFFLLDGIYFVVCDNFLSMCIK